jgi:hypothetical protein
LDNWIEYIRARRAYHHTRNDFSGYVLYLTSSQVPSTTSDKPRYRQNIEGFKDIETKDACQADDEDLVAFAKHEKPAGSALKQD